MFFFMKCALQTQKLFQIQHVLRCKLNKHHRAAIKRQINFLCCTRTFRIPPSHQLAQHQLGRGARGKEIHTAPPTKTGLGQEGGKKGGFAEPLHLQVQ